MTYFQNQKKDNYFCPCCDIESSFILCSTCGNVECFECKKTRELGKNFCLTNVVCDPSKAREGKNPKAKAARIGHKHNKRKILTELPEIVSPTRKVFREIINTIIDKVLPENFSGEDDELMNNLDVSLAGAISVNDKKSFSAKPLNKETLNKDYDDKEVIIQLTVRLKVDEVQELIENLEEPYHMIRRH